MNRPRSLWLTLLSFLALPALGTDLDGVPDALLERLRAPQTETSGVGAFEARERIAPRVLLSHAGDDNACSLHLRTDVNGDRVPDLVVGWDLFKSGNNLEVLSGAGFGTQDTIWGLETGDGISGGYFSDIDQTASYPDINGDGIEELLTGTSGGGRAATLYDGASGTVLQSFNTYLGAQSGWVYDVEVVSDVNSNGTADFAIAVGSDADAVYMIDGGQTGEHHEEIWTFSGLDAFYTLALIGDIDADGVPDLVAGSGDNEEDVHALSGRTGEEIWHIELKGSVLDVAAFPDFDGDGVDEVVAGTWSSSNGVVLLEGATGEIIWSSGELNTFIMRVAPIDDLDGDGSAEIAVASWANDAYVLDGRDGSSVWSAPTGGDVWAIDRVDDVTGDGLSEVAFGSFDGFAYLADGLTGEILWAHDAGGHKVLALESGPDMDGDGNPELLVGAQQLDSGEDDLVWVLSADSGISSAGPELTMNGTPAPGGEIEFVLSQAEPSRTVRWLWGTEATLDPTPGLGTIAVTPRHRLGESTVDNTGVTRFPFSIPDDPSLIGSRFYVQAIEVIDFKSPSGRSSNRVGLLIER